jgi:hypothetical protein
MSVFARMQDATYLELRITGPITVAGMERLAFDRFSNS